MPVPLRPPVAIDPGPSIEKPLLAAPASPLASAKAAPLTKQKKGNAQEE
jgi:hypothetical protein